MLFKRDYFISKTEIFATRLKAHGHTSSGIHEQIILQMYLSTVHKATCSQFVVPRHLCLCANIPVPYALRDADTPAECASFDLPEMSETLRQNPVTVATEG